MTPELSYHMGFCLLIKELGYLIPEYIYRVPP